MCACAVQSARRWATGRHRRRPAGCSSHTLVSILCSCFPCRNVPHVSEAAAASAAPSPADFIVDAAGVPVSMAYCFAESGPYDEFFARAGTAAVCALPSPAKCQARPSRRLVLLVVCFSGGTPPASKWRRHPSAPPQRP
jgi:hypothetical protein